MISLYNFVQEFIFNVIFHFGNVSFAILDLILILFYFGVRFTLVNFTLLSLTYFSLFLNYFRKFALFLCNFEKFVFFALNLKDFFLFLFIFFILLYFYEFLANLLYFVIVLHTWHFCAQFCKIRSIFTWMKILHHLRRNLEYLLNFHEIFETLIYCYANLQIMYLFSWNFFNFSLHYFYINLEDFASFS